MSKSKGNVVTPMGLLEEHGADAVRYWAAKGGPGVDTAFDPAQMKIGRRLAIKLLNASKFALMKTAPVGPVTEPYDAAMLRRLVTVVERATRSLDEYDYAAALRDIETFFWGFCDDYIELVKRRRSRDDAGAASANQATQLALSVMLRLFAPFLPFVTEEVWSWWQSGSVHRAQWPSVQEIAGHASETDVAYARASELAAVVRQQRSERQLGFSVPVQLRMAGVDPDVWPLIARDVLEGNNVVGDPTIEFGGPPLSATIEPVRPDA
jgi:valyl-tRNA synthetase